MPHPREKLYFPLDNVKIFPLGCEVLTSPILISTGYVMIEVENLTKYYGTVRGIENVSFTVKRGEVVGFLGPNGSGKTTTMRILTCFFPQTEGTARVAGYDVLKSPLEVRKRIGYVPETVPLYPDMKVTTYLRFVAEAKRMSRPDARRKIPEVMDRCGITEVSSRLVGNLSKGYRQRVGLAQALLNDPEVLILDEPTIGLDPRQIVEVRQFIKSLAEDRTIILSTHILPEVSMTCGRVMIIHQGRIVAVDTPENLTESIQRTQKTFIRIEGPQEDVARELRNLPAVTRVEVEDSGALRSAAYVVECAKGAELGGELTGLLFQNRWKLLEMRSISMSLEDIFIHLVTEEREV